MNNSKNLFNIPLIFGKSDLLRLSKDLNIALGLKDRMKGIARLPDGRDLPIIINPVHETIVGLGPWFAECDTSKYNSVEITVVENKEENILLSVQFSTAKHNPYSKNSTHQMQIPDEGLYLGQKLESEFLKIRPTNEPVTLNKSDLLKHIFICGKTGTGKTVLAKILLEEVALLRIPVIAIDLKGDISSLAIQATGEDPRDLIPWIPVREGAEKEKKAAEISSGHREHLKEWGFDFIHPTDFNKKVRVQVFTPRSDVGFRLAISPFVEPNIDIDELREEDQDSFEEFVEFMANSFVSRLTLNKQKSEKAGGYVYEIIKSFWQKGISLKGYVGIERILDEIKNDSNGIETIGEMLTNEYITTRDRDIISDSINRLTIGAQKRGFPSF